MKKVGILYDNISGNTGDRAIGVSVRRMLDEMGVDYEELSLGRFNPGDYPTIIIGGGHLLRPCPDFFYDKFRVPGKHILNCCGILDSPDDLQYLNDYRYATVRSKGDRQKLSYLSREVTVVPCTTMLLKDLPHFDLKIQKPSIGVQLWEGGVDEESFVEYLSNQPFHIYFLPITHYNHDFKYLAKLSQRVKNSTLLPVLRPEEIFTLIGKLDYFITASLHGAIFAYVHEVPFILFNACDKQTFFMEDRKLDSYLFRNFDELHARFEELQNNKPDYSTALANDFKVLQEHKLQIRDIVLKQVITVDAKPVITRRKSQTKEQQAILQESNFQIHYLQKQVEALNIQPKELRNSLQDRDAQIANLETSLQEKVSQIHSLESQMHSLESQMQQIQHSIPMQLVNRYQTIVDKLMRPGTRRRRPYELGLSGIRVILNEGWKSFWAKFKQWLRDRNLKQKYSSSNLRSIDDLSTRLYSVPKRTKIQFNPKVSVIVPNYNHARYLHDRLESIYRQTYQNIEVILLDDASNDDSTSILEDYRRRFPEITKCSFNKNNSGGVFYQWKKGIELAQGELIWIAESDDYCSENMLEELVKFFANEAVMLAYSRTVFVDGETKSKRYTLEQYLADLVDPRIWEQPFIKSAHQLVNAAWSIKNIVPNVSSAIFRNTGEFDLLNDENWKSMTVCGDWIFYLRIIRGGLVAYTPKATSYFRMHGENTSVASFQQDIYYCEYEEVAEELIEHYHLQEGILEKQRQALELQWQLNRADCPESHFKECYDNDRIRNTSRIRKPNLLMVAYALVAGGGETFAIKLANLLKAAGYGVTLLNCQREPTEIGIRAMLRRDIPLLELDDFYQLNVITADLGIDILHSHHAWADIMICTLLANNLNCKVVITIHGMYEMMSPAELARHIPILSKRVDKFVYAAEKNLHAFNPNIVNRERFVKITHALDKVPIKPVPREELGIDKDDFVLCLVSRAIPEKGWEEGIEAVRIARRLSDREIHLLLIGEGPEYRRLRSQVGDHFIHFLGFKANIRDYFAASDLGFLPSRFPGESFPLVIIDCFQANRPVLASNIGEIAKMIETDSGPAGRLFPLDNWRIPIQRVAEMIVEYATNNDLYLEHLGRVPEASKKFDIEKMLHSYEMVYQEVLDDTNNSGNLCPAHHQHSRRLNKRAK